MSGFLRKRTGTGSQDGLEPELARFQHKLGESVRQTAGETPSMSLLRRASRAARIGWSLAGPVVPMVEIYGLGMPARLFRPPGEGPLPLLVYLHGGGWTLLDLDTHDRMMRRYALQNNWAVLGLDYPLAPEVQFPDSLNACVSAINKILDKNASHGLAVDYIVLGGDSSGANLAISATQAHIEAGGNGVAGLLLNYGVFDSTLDRPSYIKFGKPPNLLTTEKMDYFWSQYCRHPKDRTDPRAAPLRMREDQLGTLPAVHMAVAGQDVLADENLLLAQKLDNAGVDVSCIVYEDASHGFLEALDYSPVADQAFADTGPWFDEIRHRR